MNIDDLTLGQIKQIQSQLGEKSHSDGLNTMIGKKCIVRTYSAGVWFGEVAEKSGNEVIVKNARRLWKWFAKESVSLSAVSIYGINHDKSKVAEAVSSIWLEAIELIPATEKSIISIEGAPNVKAS